MHGRKPNLRSSKASDLIDGDDGSLNRGGVNVIGTGGNDLMKLALWQAWRKGKDW